MCAAWWRKGFSRSGRRKGDVGLSGGEGRLRPALEFDVSPGIAFTQAPERISGALEAANALSLIDRGVCPIRTVHARGVDAKHSTFATSLGQVPPRHIKLAPVVRHDDGSRSFDPVDDVERHRLSTVSHGRA